MSTWAVVLSVSARAVVTVEADTWGEACAMSRLFGVGGPATSEAGNE